MVGISSSLPKQADAETQRWAVLCTRIPALGLVSASWHIAGGSPGPALPLAGAGSNAVVYSFPTCQSLWGRALGTYRLRHGVQGVRDVVASLPVEPPLLAIS